MADNMRIRDWRLLGSCRSHDPELFFPASESSFFAAQIAEAKQVCVGCPVLSVCRQHALSTSEPYGIWGALTESERNSIRRHGSGTREQATTSCTTSTAATDASTHGGADNAREASVSEPRTDEAVA